MDFSTGRRSAKMTIYEITGELLARPESPENNTKLALIQTIASKVGWMDLFNKIQYRSRARTWTPYKEDDDTTS